MRRNACRISTVLLIDYDPVRDCIVINRNMGLAVGWGILYISNG
ncbi:hypothetical protein CIT292_07380 [Citrobacter youngae ATCC 29220]|uniref:Uncharacterized protein n=1 Tax=Citrobacter youngae ATCC 29220 TaxID=500640 RepID=D4BA88_9ENTR|nr:hypothetical protein CIT292_07380 [Citrobacter youngae ATCC 29220]